MSSWSNGFVRIPNPILAHPALTMNEKIIFSIVLSYKHNEKQCYLSGASLSKMTALSEPTIDRVLSSLERKNLIVRIRHEKNGRMRYLVVSESAHHALSQMAKEARREAAREEKKK